MAPIRKGDGTPLEIPGVSEVRAGDGRVFFEGDAIPDIGMFQSPIYQFWPGEYEGDDGDSPFELPEVLAGLADASAEGDPTYREDFNGFETADLDGTDDAFEWDPDSQIPLGDDPHSIVALFYPRDDSSGDQNIIGWGTDNADEITEFRIRDGNINHHVWEGDVSGGSINTNEWNTAGLSYDGNTTELYLNGSFSNDRDFGSLSVVDQNHAIGFRSFRTENYLDAGVAEIIVSDVAEPASTFNDFHEDRLG